MERDNPWPQHPTPPPSLLQGLASPPPGRSNAFTVGDSGFIGNTDVATVRASKFLSIQECAHKFREWHSGGGTLSSPKNREKSLVLKVSARDLVNLKELLGIDDESDKKFPLYTFNSASSTLTFRCFPSPIHGQVVSTISEGFYLALFGLPANTKSKIYIIAPKKYIRFYAKYDGSEIISDIAVQIYNDMGNEVKFILEVGLSESYEKLVEDAQLWLEGTKTVSVVMLVKLYEDPPYNGPTHDLTDEEFNALQFPPKNEINQQSFVVNGQCGPATYKGLTWVGSISGFIEIWGFEGASRSACRISDRIDLLSADKSMENYFSMSNFIDIADNDHPIRFDWATYFENLRSHIKELAFNRCYITLRDRNRQVNASSSLPAPPNRQLGEANVTGGGELANILSNL
ncbi:hypothetical protein B9Z19DRAFT_1196865 [Tuber borchii]|uniref:Uncharacterized protein n=1 Tax=Tuber borchii TaxID=42251 RepID=A0A2T6ZDD8_TUBBO|nr:hypothetical protein B9Z19DRAFT_1196865 [Tuber borchii]